MYPDPEQPADDFDAEMDREEARLEEELQLDNELEAQELEAESAHAWLVERGRAG